jgi:glycerol-3-phosphate dehydrogenase
MERVINGARRIVPRLPLAAAITEFSGLRAASGDGDFILCESEIARGLIHAAGIQSPGFTAAPAIAEVIAGILREAGLDLIEKPAFNPTNPPRRVFREMSWQERAEMVAADPHCGRVICRCETVTEGEIVAAIHSLCGARTVDGVKRRTRAGTGRCQGGFCGPRVTAILARELGVPITAIRKDGVHSFLFADKLPGVCEVSADE